MAAETSFSQSIFTDLCERMLRLCKLSPGESLVLLSQGDERREYVDAFMAAGQRLGASTMNVRLPYSSSATDGAVGVWTVGKTPLAANRPAIETLKRADMVVETLFLLFSDELTEIQSAGTRILTCIEPVDLLARMFPTEELTRRTDVAVEVLSAARELRFTNRAGTDVTYQVGGYPVKPQYGYVDKPGQWDHWPSGGMVLTCGADDGIGGRVVVDRGDILLPFKQYVVDPIEFTRVRDPRAVRAHDRQGRGRGDHDAARSASGVELLDPAALRDEEQLAARERPVGAPDGASVRILDFASTRPSRASTRRRWSSALPGEPGSGTTVSIPSTATRPQSAETRAGCASSRTPALDREWWRARRP